MSTTNNFFDTNEVQTFEVITSAPIQKPDVVAVTYPEIVQPTVIQPTQQQQQQKQLLCTWEVEEAPIFNEHGKKLIGYKQLRRSDNGQMLSVVSGTYKPFSNKVFYDVCNNIANYNQLVTLSEHDNGSRLVAKFQSEPFEVKGYTFHSYIIFTNSHDYSTPLSLGEFNSMTRCSNQFARVQGVTMRHTTQVQTFDFNTFFGQYNALKTRLINTFNQLSGVEITSNQIQLFLNDMFAIGLDTQVSTRKQNILDTVNDCIEIESVDLGQTAFMLFNAITRYNTHHARTQDRSYSTLFGSISQMNQKALNYFL